MEVLILDDEELVLKDFVRQWNRLTIPQLATAHLAQFTRVHEALDYCAAQDRLDLAILDINMPEMNGLELAKRLQVMYPACRIIFLTGYSEYAIEAFKLKIYGYLLKPVSLEDLDRELRQLLNDLKPQEPILRAQCFGRFGFFVDEVPVLFNREKVKELFAYLVAQRGAFVSVPELVAVLWEDRPDSSTVRSQLRNNIAFLNKALKECGAAEILLRYRNEIAVDTSKFTCDYYEFLAGDKKARDSFSGEFMYSYSWGENINAELIEKKNKNVV